MSDRKGKAANIPIRTLSKREQEELKKKEHEKAAEVFEEFLASFDTSDKTGVKTFVRGGIVNATKEEEEAEVRKSKLYRPATKVPPVAQNASPVQASVSDIKKSALKKKTEEKKKSNLELFKEELKQIQEEREERHKRKKNDPGGAAGGAGGVGGYGDLDAPLLRRSIFDDDPTVPNTTNLYIGCINPKMNEEMLCKEFGKYGPLASVKIMWPRTDEERTRTTNRGFVAFMTRRDAERALAALDAKTVMGFEMKLGWGKAVRIPPQPLYTPIGVLKTATPPPPSGLPFNAQPRDRKDRFRNDFTKPWDTFKEDLDKTLSEAVVKVVIPTQRNLLGLIHRMIEFVVREGPMFEAIIMNKEKSNADFRFLFDNKSQDHVYYRWKLYSILQGEAPSEWKTPDFRMFRMGSLWRPPLLKPYLHRDEEEDEEEEEEEAQEEEEVKKGQLKTEHREKLELLLRQLSPRREDIGDAMLFCLQRADAAEEVVGHITDSLSLLQTPLQKKVARLYLVSDILYNSCAKVASASYYRKYFEIKLPQIFGEVKEAYRNVQARLQAEQFKQKVMCCFRAWEDWAIYPEPYLLQLQNIFLGLVKAEELVVEVSSPDLDGAPLDGAPLSDRGPVDDIDGCPLAWDPAALDGLPVDDIDGVPLGATIDDIDGMPLDDGSLPLSKWERVADTEAFSQDKTESEPDTEEDVTASNAQDGDSEDDSSDDSASLSKYDNANFKSSLSSFQMSETKRSKLRELEVKVVKFQDELESGKTSRKSGMSVQQQVEHYRNKLLQKEFDKDDKEKEKKEKKERSTAKSKSKERSKKEERREKTEERRDKDKSKKSEDREKKRGRSRDSEEKRSRDSEEKRGRSRDSEEKSGRSRDSEDKRGRSRDSEERSSPSKTKSPKRSRRSRSPSAEGRGWRSSSRSPHRSHKKSKKSRH